MTTALASYNPEASDDYIVPYTIPEKIEYPASEGSALDEGESGVTTLDKKRPDVPIKLIPPLDPLKGRFKMLQLWVGRVIEIRGGEFTAIISDKTNPGVEDQIVAIDFEDITPDEVSLLETGAVFYWSVGYFDYPGRGRSRESRIRFRRLTGPSKADIARSGKTGKEFAEFFKSHSTCSPRL